MPFVPPPTLESFVGTDDGRVLAGRYRRSEQLRCGHFLQMCPTLCLGFMLLSANGTASRPIAFQESPTGRTTTTGRRRPSESFVEISSQ
jgi:hypothetical protein